MTSVYTELTKEAAKKGGPAALKAFYRNVGRGQGAVVGVAVASVGALLYNKVTARRASSSAELVPETEGADGTDDSTPGKEDEAQRLEGRDDTPPVLTAPGQ